MQNGIAALRDNLITFKQIHCMNIGMLQDALTDASLQNERAKKELGTAQTNNQRMFTTKPKSNEVWIATKKWHNLLLAKLQILLNSC